MNRTEHELELMRLYLEGVASLEETQALESLIVTDAGVRQEFLRYTHLDSALAGVRRSQPSVVAPSRSVWLSWRPLTAAAAGIVFGMLCTSVVFGFVTQRTTLVEKVPLAVFDPGFENLAPPLYDGLPNRVGQWGVDSAKLVPAENGVQPLEGQHMLRLEPIPHEKQVKNHTSRVYQLLDLRAQPLESLVGDFEVQVTASFFATRQDFNSRYLIRVIALDEPPETATKEFWSKTERDDVVSVSQRYDRMPGDGGWQTCSLRIPLPRVAKTLVFILGALPPEDASLQSSAHYLDDVHVSLLASESKLP
jgi:hypothetical protein